MSQGISKYYLYCKYKYNWLVLVLRIHSFFSWTSGISTPRCMCIEQVETSLSRLLYCLDTWYLFVFRPVISTLSYKHTTPCQKFQFNLLGYDNSPRALEYYVTRLSFSKCFDVKCHTLCVRAGHLYFDMLSANKVGSRFKYWTVHSSYSRSYYSINYQPGTCTRSTWY